MPPTDSVIAVLDQFLSQKQQETAPELTVKEFFDLFAAEQAFRDIEVDLDDIQSGDVDGDGDGGIDFIYLVVNGRLIRDLEAANDLKSLKRNVTIDLILVQTTIEQKFSLARVIRLKDALGDILSIHRDPLEFSENYNEGLRDAIERFRIAHRVLATTRPTLNVSVLYASKGDAVKILKIPNDVKRKADALTTEVKVLLPTVTNCDFTFLGARELLELAYTAPKITYNLRCQDSMPSDRGGYVSLVKLADFYRFITEDGQLIDHVFDSNVRDYQGDVEVNKAIRGTLGDTNSTDDFWWLNNGITIIATKVTGDLRNLIIDDPRIVNGLQTSIEIHEYFKGCPDALGADKRLTVVRTIESQNDQTRDKIIEATNSQTGMPPASLWATDPIHRELEHLFELPKYGLHYDRRKNFWRNKDALVSKIVGITELAQAVIAIALQEPDMARARPARYFKKTEKGKNHYKEVFNQRRYTILDVYPNCAMLRKKTERFLKTVEKDRQHRNNFLFYVLMTASCLATNNPKPSPVRLARLDVSKIDDSLLAVALTIVRPIYNRLGATDKAAKGTEMVRKLKKRLQRELPRVFVRTKKASKK
jgi:hypothetical protein